MSAACAHAAVLFVACSTLLMERTQFYNLHSFIVNKLFKPELTKSFHRTRNPSFLPLVWSSQYQWNHIQIQKRRFPDTGVHLASLLCPLQGPKPADCLHLLRSFPHMYMVRGNHEHMIVRQGTVTGNMKGPLFLQRKQECSHTWSTLCRRHAWFSAVRERTLSTSKTRNFRLLLGETKRVCVAMNIFPSTSTVLNFQSTVQVITLRSQLFWTQSCNWLLSAGGLTGDDLAFLRELPYTLTLPRLGVIVVHAGLIPGIPLHQQSTTDMIWMRNIVTVSNKRIAFPKVHFPQVQNADRLLSEVRVSVSKHPSASDRGANDLREDTGNFSARQRTALVWAFAKSWGVNISFSPGPVAPVLLCWDSFRTTDAERVRSLTAEN